MKLTTSIVIPVYNAVAYTRQLLDAMMLVSPPDQLIIVDNGSTDGTKDYFQTLDMSRTLIISNDTNLGFTRAVNQGLRAATGEAIIVLSNDVKIIDPSWLAEIEHHLRLNPRSFCGPMLIADNPWVRMENGESIPYIAGYLMAFRKEFLYEVGYLDERFWAYFEDVDWSYRAARAGWRLDELEGLGTFHYGGRTGMLLPNPMKICAESKVKFGQKWDIGWQWDGMPPISEMLDPN